MGEDIHATHTDTGCHVLSPPGTHRSSARTATSAFVTEILQENSNGAVAALMRQDSELVRQKREVKRLQEQLAVSQESNTKLQVTVQEQKEECDRMADLVKVSQMQVNPIPYPPSAHLPLYGLGLGDRGCGRAGGGGMGCSLGEVAAGGGGEKGGGGGMGRVGFPWGLNSGGIGVERLGANIGAAGMRDLRSIGGLCAGGDDGTAGGTSQNVCC